MKTEHYTLQELVVEQSLLIEAQNKRLNEVYENTKRILKLGIYTTAEVENIITIVLSRAREKAERQVENIIQNCDDKTKNEILNAIWFSTSGVMYKDLLYIPTERLPEK